MIHYQCPSCGAAMESPTSAAGEQEKCPACGASATVPSSAPANGVQANPDPGGSPRSAWSVRGALRAAVRATVSRPRVALSVGAALLVLLFAVFFWPGLYRYDHMNVHGNVFPVRVNRLTGKTEIFYPTGWEEPRKPLTESRESDESALLLPPHELAKVKVEGVRIDRSELRYRIFNGTARPIAAVQVVVQMSSPGWPKERDFVLRWSGVDNTLTTHRAEPGSWYEGDIYAFGIPDPESAKWSVTLRAAKWARD